MWYGFTNFPSDFKDKKQLASLLADQITLCKAAAYVRKMVSTILVQGKEKNLNQMDPIATQFFKAAIYNARPNLKTALSKPEKKIRTVEDLKLFAKGEIERLDHWYVWNGHYKAVEIEKSLQKLNEQWTKDKDLQNLPDIAARESGLIDALAIHRHTFFYHGDNKAASHQSLLEKCPANNLGI